MIASPRRRTVLLFVILLCAGTALGAASSLQTNNYVLRALPASKQVNIDGRLGEWDLSGQILMCYDVSQLLERNSVKAAALFDDKHLYLSFRFRDDSPMQNYVNPKANPGGGWRSDSVEIRIRTDQIVNVETWYHTEAMEPAMWIGYGRAGDWKSTLSNPLQQGAKMAFRRMGGGQGYVQELALPWDLLFKEPTVPSAGESIRLGLQMNWGGPTAGKKGSMPSHRLVDLINPEHPQRSFFWSNPKAWGTLKFLAEGKVSPSPSMDLLNAAERLRRRRYSTSGPVTIEYELPADGYATLVIEQPDGTRVRNLISDYPRKKGHNVDYWDGTDDQGRLVAPGTYRVRGLFHEDLDVRYEFSFGAPNANPRGGWMSNHCNNLAVLADENHVYVASPMAEGPYPLMALNYEGEKVWGALARWKAGFMARSGDYLYVLTDNEVRPARERKDLKRNSTIQLIRIDPETGREVPFPDGNSKHALTEWNIQKLGVAKKWFGWCVEHDAFDADWPCRNAMGLAAHDGRLYASLHFEDRLLQIDPERGKVTGEIALEAPAGLVSDGRHLLAVSGKTVVQVDPRTGETKPLITARLKAPVGLTVDSEDNIYVSDWADKMCVKVFASDGRHRRNIGTMGGRAWEGPYDPQGMLLPAGISCDGRDRLWVAEYDFSPRRVSCWETETGKLVMERVGRGRYGGMGYYVFPDNPAQGLLNNNLLDLDWERGRWRVRSTLWRGTQADQVMGLDPYTRFGKVINRNGRRLLVHTARRPQHGPVIISELTEDGRALPLAAVGYCVQTLSVPGEIGGMDSPPVFADHLWMAPELNRAARQEIPWFFEGPRAGGRRAPWREAGRIARRARRQGWRPQEGQSGFPRPFTNFAWSDLNRDGGLQDAEISYYKPPGFDVPQRWGPETWSGGVVDEDLTMYLTAIRTTGKTSRARHYRLPVSRWTEDGVPVYRPENAELITASPYMGQAAWLSREDHLLTLGNLPANVSTRGPRDPLVMYRPDGSIAWTFPSPWTGVHGSHTAPKEKRGQLVGPLGVLGEVAIEGVGEVFAFHTNVGTAEFFTADGLYLGRLFRDGRSAPESWPAQPRPGRSLNGMSNGGEWFGGQFFQRPGGKRYLVCSRGVGTVAEVTGLETTRRLPGQSISFTTGQYRQARKLAEESEKQEKDIRTLRVRPIESNRQPPQLDAFSWDSSHSASWRYDRRRSARAGLACDAENLYVAFRVEDDSPMVNTGEDVRRLFKFGDATVLELRTNPRQKSQQVAEGDVRLLFSVHQGQPVAVLYDYRDPHATEPVEFTSVTTTRIDRLEVLKEARVEINRTEEGYTLRAAVPLKAIGWTPRAGSTYPGDLGIVYSDTEGTRNELRMYWSNQATGIVSDLSLEAAIQPARWGRFVIEEAK